MALKNGEVLIGRFTIISAIGSERTATIFKALDSQLNKYVAIKVLATKHCSVDVIESFERQVKRVKSIDHDGIAHIYELFFEHDLIFYAMELSEGESLFSRLRNAISPEEASNWISQLLDIANAFHQNSCLLGEIRMDKIIVDITNNIHLMDFGTGPSTFHSGQIFSQLSFDAPELKKEPVTTTESDIYSLGKVIELLVQSIDVDKVDKQERAKNKAILAIVKKMTHVQPQKRLAIEECVSLISEQQHTLNQHKYVKRLVFIAFLVTLSCAIWFVKNDTDDTIAAKQISIVADSSLSDVHKVAMALDIPMAIFPTLSMVKVKESTELVERLDLKLQYNVADRRELASILNLDFLITITTKQISDDQYILSAFLRQMPSDLIELRYERKISQQSITRDLSSFAQTFLSKVDDWQDSKLDIKLDNYTQFFSTVLSNSSERYLDLEVLKQKAPQYRFVWLKSAQDALDKGNSAQALEYLQRLRGMQSSSDYWTLQSDWLDALIQEDLSLMTAAAENLMRRFPDRPNDLLMFAKNLGQQGDFAAQRQYLNTVTGLQPNHADVFVELGKVQMQTGEIDTAINHSFKNAIKAYRLKQDLVAQSNTMLLMGEANLILNQEATANRLFRDAWVLLSQSTNPAHISHSENLRKRLTDLGVDGLDEP